MLRMSNSLGSGIVNTLFDDGFVSGIVFFESDSLIVALRTIVCCWRFQIPSLAHTILPNGVLYWTVVFWIQIEMNSF